MHGFSPARYAPAVLPAHFTLLQIGKLPQMVDSVQIAHLHEPRADALHDFSSGLEAPTPMRFPLEKVAGLKLIRPQLEEAAQLPRRRSGPEAEFLHQRRLLFVDQRPQLAVKVGEFGVLRNGVQGTMIARIALVLPDMDCDTMLGLPTPR